MNEQFILQVPPRNDGTPRWATEIYPGMENEIKEWLFSYYFWKFWDERGGDIPEDIEALAKSNAEARFKALTQTSQLRGAMDSSFLAQLYEAHTTNWFRYFQEIEDIKELLDHLYHTAYENDPHSSSRYEFEFLVKTLIPTLEELGVKKELIIQIPQNMGKARAAISTMRQIIAEDTDQKEEKLVEVLSDITDPTLTFREFKRKNAERMNKSRGIVKGEMKVAIVPAGDVIVIKCSAGITQAIERSLQGLVDEPTIEDPGSLLRYVSDLVLPKRRKHENQDTDKLSSEIQE